MADPPGAGAGQGQCHAEVERQLSPLEWPEVPRGWYETSSRYVAPTFETQA